MQAPDPASSHLASCELIETVSTTFGVSLSPSYWRDETRVLTVKTQRFGNRASPHLSFPRAKEFPERWGSREQDQQALGKPEWLVT